MQSVVESLGNQRYAQLQLVLQSPSMRVQRILQVTAARWWPDGQVPLTRKAAGRLVRTHRDREHGHALRARRHA